MLNKFLERAARLKYVDEQGRQGSLPRWCFWFLRLGYMAAEASADRPVIFAASLPTIVHATSFTAIGALAYGAQSIEATGGSEFCRLAELPIGTPLRYISGNRQFRGVFMGVSCGYICIQVQDKRGGNLTFKVPGNLAGNICVLEGSPILPKTQRGRQVELVPLIPELFGLTPEASIRYTMQCRPECLMVGSRARIRAELSELRLAFDRDLMGSSAGGIDIVRPRGSVPAHQGWRTLIAANNNLDHRLPSVQEASCLVVSGSSQVLRFTGWDIGKSVVALLDRTERSFALAADALNQRRLRAPTVQGPRVDDGLPSGVEAMAIASR